MATYTVYLTVLKDAVKVEAGNEKEAIAAAKAYLAKYFEWYAEEYVSETKKVTTNPQY